MLEASYGTGAILAHANPIFGVVALIALSLAVFVPSLRGRS